MSELDTMEKYNKLKEILKEMGSCLVAFSGGVDSTFLLKVAYDTLGQKAVAATAVSYIYPSYEASDAVDFAKEYGIEQIKINYDPIKSVIGFKENSIDRCYICKKALFTNLVETAENLGLAYVVDGTNVDDLGDYRPGLRAIEELKIKSPLLEAGLTKAEIRSLAKKEGLKVFNKPAIACLASRIPTNEVITESKLSKVDKAEAFLIGKGFSNLRVRCHGKLARIEVASQDINKFFDPELIKEVDSKLKEIGFKFVSLDLAGYKMGNMN